MSFTPYMSAHLWTAWYYLRLLRLYVNQNKDLFHVSYYDCDYADIQDRTGFNTYTFPSLNLRAQHSQAAAKAQLSYYILTI